jgi:hypothetical protein
MTLSNSHEFPLVLRRASRASGGARLRALNKKREDQRLQSRVTKINGRVLVEPDGTGSCELRGAEGKFKDRRWFREDQPNGRL